MTDACDYKMVATGELLKICNTEALECPDKSIPATTLLPLVNCVSSESAFRHQGQFSGHGLVRHC
jgi:hypothetical protein